MSKRTRLNIFLSPEHAARLKALATMRGVSQSSIVNTALNCFMSPDGGDQREAAMTKRLDRLNRQFDKLERDQNILIETLAIYVQYFLSVSQPIPEVHREAARAQGRQRYRQFIEQLANHLQRGNSLVKEIHDEIYPHQSAFYGVAEPDGQPGEEDSPP